MTKLKLTRVGNSVGLVLPKEVLARLHVDAGDVLYLTESPEGCRLSPFDPDFERQMNVAEGIMHADREILRALAK